MRYGERDDVAGIYHLNVVGGNDLHGGDAASVIVYVRNELLKYAIADEYFFFVSSGNLLFVDGGCFVEDLLLNSVKGGRFSKEMGAAAFFKIGI